MACNCIEKMDGLLSERNTRLVTRLVFGDEVGEFPSIQTAQVETGRGKKKATGVLPTYCPFCGTKYKNGSDE